MPPFASQSAFVIDSQPLPLHEFLPAQLWPEKFGPEFRGVAAAYLASNRRIPFNEHGIFRHYPELDGVRR